MWVWGSNSVLDASRRNQLLAFAVEKGVNLLYVGAWSALNNDPQTLADFIRSCKTRGIEVELLFGERAWAFYENHYKVLDIIDKVIDFANRYPDAKPVAIHLDVEPYSLPEWQQDMESVANQLIDLLEAAHARLGSVMPLIADIPVWYDQRFVTRAGVTRSLDRVVIDAIDGVALMDYRDTQDRIVNDARAELSYASQTGKTVIVGVETLCIEPASITFCEEGSSVMEPILTNIDSLLPGQYSAYAGHAIHHFDSYLTLKP